MPNRTFTQSKSMASSVDSFEGPTQPANTAGITSPQLSEVSDVSTQMLPPPNLASPSAEDMPATTTLFLGTFSNTPPLTHHPMDLSDTSTNPPPSPSDLSDLAQAVSTFSDSETLSNVMAVAPLTPLETDMAMDAQHASGATPTQHLQHFEVIYNGPTVSPPETSSNSAASSPMLNCEFFVPTTHTIALSLMQGCYRYNTPADPFPPNPFPHTLTAPSSSLFTGIEWGPYVANAALLNRPRTVPAYPSGFFANDDDDITHDATLPPIIQPPLPIPIIVIDGPAASDDGNNPNSPRVTR